MHYTVPKNENIFSSDTSISFTALNLLTVTEKYVVREQLLATKGEWHIGVIQHRVQTKSAGQGSVDGKGTRYGLDGPRIESQWRARFSAPVQTGCGAHSASYTMGNGTFPGVNDRSGALTTQHLGPRIEKD